MSAELQLHPQSRKKLLQRIYRLCTGTEISGHRKDFQMLAVGEHIDLQSCMEKKLKKDIIA